MPCHCDEGWICEAHPDRAWPHDDCPGPGMPCSKPECPWWRGSKPAALQLDHSHIYPERNRRPS